MLIVAVEMVLYAVLRIFVSLVECVTSFRSPRGGLAAAATFDEWVERARALDAREGREAWKETHESHYYDYELLEKLIGSFDAAREDPERLARLLRTVFSKANLGGIDNEQMYSSTHIGTKYLVHDYLAKVMEASVILRDSEAMPPADRLAHFRFLKRSYGRTALVLSGGAGFGFFHIGVIRTLLEAKCLPKVLSGTSAGASVAAMVAVRTDEELAELLSTPESVASRFTVLDEPWSVILRRLWRHGCMYDARRSAARIRRDLLLNRDMTFEEAYRRTGRILNIPVTSCSTHSPPTVLNYITTPTVTIWSAVLASCAIPGVLDPVQLVEKVDGGTRPFGGHGSLWRDGSIKSDVPLAALTEQHNANYFVVSQVNPHLLLFNYDAEGSAGQPTARAGGSMLRGGFLSATLERLLRLEMGKWISLLSGLDLLPMAFGQDWRFLFTQETRGTVTISPPARLTDYVHVVSPPTPARIADMSAVASQCTWPKLTRISNHFLFERTLRACETYLARVVAQSSPRGVIAARNEVELLSEEQLTLAQYDPSPESMRQRGANGSVTGSASGADSDADSGGGVGDGAAPVRGGKGEDEDEDEEADDVR